MKKLDRSTIAKAQIYIGIILLIATSTGSVYIYDNKMDFFEDVSSETVTAWSESAEATNDTYPTGAHVSSYLLVNSNISRSYVYSFAAHVAILLSLSVMFILQGLFNLPGN